MSALPKPVLRGHLQRKGLMMIIGGIIFAGVNGTLFQFLYRVPKQRAYEESLKTYDGQAHYELMARYGYLQSAKVEEKD